MIDTDPEIKIHSPEGDGVTEYLNPLRILSHLWQYRQLIAQLTRRELESRYKGSFIGIGWSLIQPLLMLCVYTFVFSVIFQSRWGMHANETRADFALALFVGLITFGVFSEVVNAAPTLIINSVNYVKKVVFPLEILVVVRLFSTLINALFALLVLLCGILIVNQALLWTVLLLPLVWLPMILLTLGCGYFLASFGVFVRDLSAAVSILTTMLFFLTPIFYPLHAVPEKFRFFSQINPLALFVEDARGVMLWGTLPNWPVFLAILVISTLVCIFGYIWFVKSKKTFADVI